MSKQQDEKKEALRNANPTDIVGSVDTRGIHSRYDSPAKVAPLLDFYPEGDERDLGVDEDGEYEIMAETSPGDVEGAELESYRSSLQAESVAATAPGINSPYSKGHAEVKDPAVHDLLNPREGGRVFGDDYDPEAEVVSIEGEEDDRPARERASAEAGREIIEGNPQDVLRAEGSGEDHTVSTGLDDPQTSTTPRGEQDEAPEGTVIDVTSEASGPDGVVTGEDAKESIEEARQDRQEAEGEGIVVDESDTQNAPAQSDGEVPKTEESSEEKEGSDEEGGDSASDDGDDELPEGWESDWNKDQMLSFAQEHNIEGVNSGSKKAELIAAIKNWQG